MLCKLLVVEVNHYDRIRCIVDAQNFIGPFQKIKDGTPLKKTNIF